MIELYATIKKSGPPTKNTPGAVGQIYIDTNTGIRWECVEAHREKHYKGTQEFYDWDERGLDPDFVVGGITEAENKSSLPVELEFYSIICSGVSGNYTLPEKITLDEDYLYLLNYTYFVNNVEDPANSMTALSSVTNGVVYWGSNSPDNSVMLTADKVTDTWRTSDDTHRASYTIYKVKKIVKNANKSKYHLMTLEGRDNIASGINAHAEGRTTVASGMYSHAEGTNTVASGDHSHAEGFNTEAAGPKQHVEGMYNVIDKEGKYAHIVGNGPDGSSRSNAYTLDWEGNARFAGDVYAGGEILAKKPKAKYYNLKADGWTNAGTDDTPIYVLEIEDPDFIGQDNNVYFTCPVMGNMGLVMGDIENGILHFQISGVSAPPTEDASVMVVKHEVELERQYLTFSSPNPFTMSVAKPGWDGTIEYSTDGVNWTEWHGEEISGTILYLCGTNNTNVSDYNNKWTIDGSNVACTGNIETLLDWNIAMLGGHPVMKFACFRCMFSGCTALITAPELPATTLADSCYDSMFYGCTSLATAPELPATTLYQWCYASMFSGCTSLTTAPELPATTLDSTCYSGMFKGCTALTTAPELPATTLADSCYDSMFYGCTGLTTAPVLPATTMVNKCYYGMFYGCTALTTAPELPATTLYQWCYDSMFYGCTSLATAPVLPATTMKYRCYGHMFRNCTALTTAPELPATTLADSCYDGMFYGCTGLTTAPELPATTLADKCYVSMFYGCTSLATAPVLPATKLFLLCYQAMFSGCTALTTAPELPATTLGEGCYQIMFQDCTNLITVPELPATTLTKVCYNATFRRCAKLKFSTTQTDEYTQTYRIPTSGTGTTATSAFANMLVDTGGTFTGNPTINTTYYLHKDCTIVPSGASA